MSGGSAAARDGAGDVRGTDSVLHLRDTERKLVIVMVGLPARGKSLIAEKVSRYLQWLGYNSRVFSVAKYRRELVGTRLPAAFFEESNAEGARQRDRCAAAAVGDMMSFLGDGGGHAAIIDGANSTKRRRALIEKEVRGADGRARAKIVWVECVCGNEELVEANIVATKLGSPDYDGFGSREEVLADFRQRVAFYERVYEPLEDGAGSFVRLTDCGRKVETQNIHGYLPTRLTFFLMNLRSLGRKPIFFSRHGQSQFNTVGRLGGDSPLTERGLAYARRLGSWIAASPVVAEKPGGKLPVWCSCLRRTIQTASEVACRTELVEWRALNEIDSGTCDGMTYAEIEEKYPHEFRARAEDKLGYRYPEGESYRDLIRRLEPVLFELERMEGPVLVVAHQAVLRCLVGYFINLDVAELPHISVPLHTVLVLHPTAGGLANVEYVPLEDKLPSNPGSAEAQE